MTGGGVQTPGFMATPPLHRIQKYMKAKAVSAHVWMPRFSSTWSEKLNATARDLYGIDDFCSMIADETIAEEPESLMAYLGEKGHPALEMEPIL
jgi:acetyl-CoA synthase